MPPNCTYGWQWRWHDDPIAEEDELADPFVANRLLDGESDLDELEEGIAGINVNALPPVNGAFEPIPNERLGNPTFPISYPFEPGSEPDTIERYRDMSAFEIVLDVAMHFLKFCAYLW